MKIEERCQRIVSGEGQWGAFHQHRCEKKFTVVRDGKRYCKIHDPEYIKAKQTVSTKKFDEKLTRARDIRHREDLLTRIFLGIETNDIEKNIAAFTALVRGYKP